MSESSFCCASQHFHGLCPCEKIVEQVISMIGMADYDKKVKESSVPHFWMIKNKYMDGYKRKHDKIGMGYESLHIMELLSVQCLKVDYICYPCHTLQTQP